MAHLEKEHKDVRPALRRQDGQGVSGQRRHRERRQGSRHDPRRARRRQADLPGLLLRHPDRGGLRRGVPAERARDDPRRGCRPQRRPDRGRHRPGRRLPAGVQRLRRRLRQTLRLPAGHRSGQGRRRLPRYGRPAGRQAGQDRRIRAGCPTATPSSGPSWRCTRRACGGI